MTAISALVSKKWISVATDSLLTETRKGQDARHVEFRKTKIVPIIKFKASAAYWGLAKVGEWRTYDFLKRIAAEADNHENLEVFADYLCSELRKKLIKINCDNPVDKGIGIHLAGFEKINGQLLPELFLITNFTNTSYKDIGELSVTRNLYKNLDDSYKAGEKLLDDQRRKVKLFLDNGGMFIFNNGDPEMFNPAANAISEIFKSAKRRNVLIEESLKQYLLLASLPIEIIKNAQKNLLEKKHIRVGGQIHNLLITNMGERISTSGDDKI